MLSGVPAHVDGHMLQATEAAGASVVNSDRMWHYTEGIENYDPALGATIDLGEPRFSQAAIDAFQLDNIMSIHTGMLTGAEL